MRIRKTNPEDIPQLRQLWALGFGDTEREIDPKNLAILNLLKKVVVLQLDIIRYCNSICCLSYLRFCLSLFCGCFGDN